MQRYSRRVALAGVLVLLALVGGVIAYHALPATLALDRPPADGATVTVVDDDTGATLGSVDARIADTYDERYTGLSETGSLDEDEGMLFVYRDEGSHTYVMRNMSFPLDIVFVGADREITAIHHAPVPPAGTEGDDLEGYSGSGKYVLEVNRGWTNESGVDVGDRLDIEYGENASVTTGATTAETTAETTVETTVEGTTTGATETTVSGTTTKTANGTTYGCGVT